MRRPTPGQLQGPGGQHLQAGMTGMGSPLNGTGGLGTGYGFMGTPNAPTPGKRLKLSTDTADAPGELVAIKKFKPDKEGEQVTFTGISQSACREIMVSTAKRSRAKTSMLIPASSSCRSIESYHMNMSQLYAKSCWRRRVSISCLSMPSTISW